MILPAFYYQMPSVCNLKEWQLQNSPLEYYMGVLGAATQAHLNNVVLRVDLILYNLNCSSFTFSNFWWMTYNFFKGRWGYGLPEISPTHLASENTSWNTSTDWKGRCNLVKISPSSPTSSNLLWSIVGNDNKDSKGMKVSTKYTLLYSFISRSKPKFWSKTNQLQS